MAKTYILKAAVSDLTGGADFTRELSAGTETSGSITVSVAKGATEDSLGFTVAGEPGTNGATGDYTVEINVTTGNTNIQLSVAVARVNSAGTQQAVSASTAEQQATAGLKTFSLTAIDLGVWATGDRLKVWYLFRNSQTMSAQSVTIETGTTNAEVVAPFAASGVSVALSGVSATGSVGALGVLHDNALAGASSAISAGTLGAAIDAPISGVSTSASVGSVTPSTAANLTGTASTASAGTLAPSNTLPTTGESSTMSLGTLAPITTMPISGIAATASIGSVTPSTTVALTGIASTGSVGTLAPSATVTMTGVGLTGSVGTLTPSTTLTLTGVIITASAGTITAPGAVTVTWRVFGTAGMNPPHGGRNDDL